MQQYTYSNNQTTTLDYSSRRAPLSLTAGVLKQGFAYDNRGNLLSLTDGLQAARNKSFTYDNLDRMVTFNGPWGAGSFTYAAYGDRLSRKLGTTTDTYAYTSGRLQSVPGKTFNYNSDGDLTAITKSGISFTLDYDPFHRMRGYKENGTPRAEFGYDAQGDRLFKKAGGITTSYFTDQDTGNVLSEIPSTGTSINFIYLGTSLVARTGAADYPLAFYHADPYGTPQVMTASNGAVIWQAEYLPFGEEYTVSPETTKNHKRFIGKEKDAETGFDYFGARYMDTALGRFVATDPVGIVDTKTGKINAQMLADPQRLNRYAYGLNNPYRYVDPDGRMSRDLNPNRLPIEEGGPIPRGGGGYGEPFKFSDFFKSGKSTQASKELTVSKSRFPESAQHIEDAVAAGKPNTLTIDRANTAVNRRESLRGTETKSGLDRDEFPPAMFQEGGEGASVRHISPSDNRGSGACIGGQCRGVPDGTKVRIKVVD